MIYGRIDSVWLTERQRINAIRILYHSSEKHTRPFSSYPLWGAYTGILIHMKNNPPRCHRVVSVAKGPHTELWPDYVYRAPTE